MESGVFGHPHKMALTDINITIMLSRGLLLLLQPFFLTLDLFFTWNHINDLPGAYTNS